ncbi:MAG: hypothetical protein ACR2PK_06565, partial [Acidimicrobiales bacterium]
MSRSSTTASSVIAATALAHSALRARSQRVPEQEERVFRVVNGLPEQVHHPVWAVMQSGSLAAVFV